jgi:deoxyribose-phosphate aldolase
MPPTAEVAAIIDQTLLRPDATENDIERLCMEAGSSGFKAVCVNPCYVGLCAALLRGTGVRVAAVIGFPLGTAVEGIKRAEAQRALEDGAQELDLVMNIGLFKSGKRNGVATATADIVETAHKANAHAKVIIEASLLNEREKIDACLMVVNAGGDFVKTSTGIDGRYATVEDVQLIRRTVGVRAGVKAAGGIRTYEQLRTMVRAGANRIGTSSGVQILREARESMNPLHT